MSSGAGGLSDDSPNTLLANDIVEALLHEGLVHPSNAAELRTKLSAGTMKDADWTQMVEKMVDTSPAKEVNDET